MNIYHLASVLIEIIVILMGLKLALQNKGYGWFIALTFSIYVFYDLSRFISIGISEQILDISFLIASLSILWAFWQISKKARAS